MLVSQKNFVTSKKTLSFFTLGFLPFLSGGFTLEASSKTKNYEVINQDFTKFDFDTCKPDILFVDPPWGGKNYKELKDKEMYLSKKPMSKLLMDIWVHYPDLIILRVPTSYPTQKLIPLEKIGHYENINLRTKSGRIIYKLLVI